MSARTKGVKKKPRLEHRFCKPCWELKYCPYGPLVEQFPGPLLTPDALDFVRQNHSEIVGRILRGEVADEQELVDLIDALLMTDPSTCEWISQYRTEELACSIFGHICPVFFMGEGFTETREDRRTTRYVPRDVMLTVVRRDGQVCQVCRRYVRDDEIEFDHLIPHSRGGPTVASNLRLLCRSCNRKKRDSLAEILSEDSLRALAYSTDHEGTE